MNSIEAAQAVKDGRCEKAASESRALVLLPWGNLVDIILADDWTLVNEQPQVEEVPVTKWAVLNLDGTISSLWDEYPKGYESLTFQIVELTGTYTRPVAKKVKRREEITTKVYHMDFVHNGARVFQEWEEGAKQ